MENFRKNKLTYMVAILALAVGFFSGKFFCWWAYNGSHHNEMNGNNMMIYKYMNDAEHSMDTMMKDISIKLQGKTGDEFDKAFLSEMIMHHEGAIEMARQVLATSKRPELIKLANDIISAQTREIGQMKSWLTMWFNKTTTGAPSSPQTPPDPTGGMRACTMEAKICPDGSAVGRQGPNCEFAPCPGN